MKLEHLLKAYKQNGLNIELKDMSIDTEHARVISFADGISAAYLLDEEDIVIAMKIFCNCLTKNKLTLSNQFNHIANILNIIQKNIMLLGGITQEESNMILQSLGLFDNTLKNGKQIRHLEHSYKIEIIDGILCLNIAEIPPSKI